MTFCPRCGKDENEIVLVGARQNILKCRECGTTIFGHRQSDACPKCGNKRRAYGMSDEFDFVRKIEAHERLPGGICDECEKEILSHKEIVRQGGIYWKCKDCQREGVIKASAPLAGVVREKTGIAPPNPVGIEFTKEQGCPACGGNGNE